MDSPAYCKVVRTRQSNRQLSVRLVNSADDLNKVRTIRAAVFMGEQACPFDEEFGANDYCATHLLGCVDGEPAGCLRARFFAGFAKLEHFAVRQVFRSTHIAFLVARAGIEYARKKGYTTIYGHVNEYSEPFWRLLGGQRIEKRPELNFSGYRYCEMKLEVEPHPDPITLQTDPYVIDRPEGMWHHVGVLERSNGRLDAIRKTQEAKSVHCFTAESL